MTKWCSTQQTLVLKEDTLYSTFFWWLGTLLRCKDYVIDLEQIGLLSFQPFTIFHWHGVYCAHSCPPLCTLLLSLYMLAENTLDFCFFLFFCFYCDGSIILCVYVCCRHHHICIVFGVLIILLSLKIICIKSVLYILMFKLLKMYIYLVINVTMEWRGVLVNLLGELSFWLPLLLLWCIAPSAGKPSFPDSGL